MRSSKLLAFYNAYHQKNDVYSKPITENNFTYYYFIKYFKKHFVGVYSKKTKVLDVGCGVGSISFYLASKGIQVVGIDVSSRAISLCKKVAERIGLSTVSFIRKELDTKPEQNDIVVCGEIIEHIKDDAAFVSLLTVKLKKNGYLFLSTPSKENWWYSLGLFSKFDTEVGHIRRYSKESLTKLLTENGFAIEALYATESILRNSLYLTRLGFLIKFIRGPLVPLFHYIDAVFVAISGPCNYFVVARKR